MNQLSTILRVLCLLGWSATGMAHDHQFEREMLMTAVKNIASQVRYGRTQVERLISIDQKSGPEALIAAHAALLTNQLTQATVILGGILSSPGYRQTAGYAEAEYLYGEVMRRLGFHRTAAMHFSNSVLHPSVGQAAFRTYFAHLVDHASAHTPATALTTGWTRFLTLKHTESALDSMTYRYARARYRGSDYDVARRLFSAVKASSSDFPRAQHFMAVIALRNGSTLEAKTHLYRAWHGWQAQRSSVMPTRKSTDAPNLVGPRRQLRRTEVPQLTADQAQYVQVGAAIQLALARLHAHTGEWARAFEFYRLIPPGLPDYTDAMREGVHALAAQGQFAWAHRMLGRVIQANRTLTILQGTDRLLYGELLAKSDEMSAAEHQFETLARSVGSWSETRPIRIANTSGLVEGARWIAPDIVKQAVSVEESRQALPAALATANALYEVMLTVAKTTEPVPFVRRSIASIETIRIRHQQAQQTMNRLSREAPGLPHQKQLRRALARLAMRIERYAQRVKVYERIARQRLAETIGKIGPELTSLKAQLDDLSTTFRLADTEGRAISESRLRALDTQAVLGLPNIAYWHKEAITAKIQRLANLQASALASQAEPMDIEAIGGDDQRLSGSEDKGHTSAGHKRLDQNGRSTTGPNKSTAHGGATELGRKRES
ncbi:MAG: hypothetical protein VX589_07500 [Myxococcota bacterium]|nr:hypothetical protein [Myxococcota bacterium]